MGIQTPTENWPTCPEASGGAHLKEIEIRRKEEECRLKDTTTIKLCETTQRKILPSENESRAQIIIGGSTTETAYSEKAQSLKNNKGNWNIKPKDRQAQETT